MAYCVLGIRKSGAIKRTGRSPLCAPVTEAIESQGNSEILGADLRLKLECATGVVKEKYCKAVNAFNS